MTILEMLTDIGSIGGPLSKRNACTAALIEHANLVT